MAKIRGVGAVELNTNNEKTVSFYDQSPNFKTFMDPKNRFQGTNSASLCGLAGRYDNPIPTRFLTPIDCLKISAQEKN
jgi:hypothetical protein